MALNASTLKSLMKSKIDSIDISSGEEANDQVLQALAEAIIEHITLSGQVVVASGSSAGVYPIT